MHHTQRVNHYSLMVSGLSYLGCKLTTHLEALDIWETVEEYDVPELPTNSMCGLDEESQRGEEEKTLRLKIVFFFVVKKIIFTRVMNLKSATDIWYYLKAQHQGSERTRDMSALI